MSFLVAMADGREVGAAMWSIVRSARSSTSRDRPKRVTVGRWGC